jgi:hypothetical protein
MAVRLAGTVLGAGFAADSVLTAFLELIFMLISCFLLVAATLSTIA